MAVGSDFVPGTTVSLIIYLDRLKIGGKGEIR
jgi:hypothetical protein